MTRPLTLAALFLALAGCASDRRPTDDPRVLNAATGRLCSIIGSCK